MGTTFQLTIYKLHIPHQKSHSINQFPKKLSRTRGQFKRQDHTNIVLLFLGGGASQTCLFRSYQRMERFYFNNSSTYETYLTETYSLFSANWLQEELAHSWIPQTWCLIWCPDQAHIARRLDLINISFCAFSRYHWKKWNYAHKRKYLTTPHDHFIRCYTNW